MSRITLRQLKYFDALAREQHFGRAARACAISQPALSMQVRELEQILGITLIERGPKQVQLTRFGERVAERAVGILRAVDDLEAIGRTAHDQFGGTLRLGMIPTIAPYLLPAVVKNLGKAYPDLAVQVREAMTARLIEELLDGRLDTAIVALPVSEANLTEQPLFDEAFLLVRPASDQDLPVPAPDQLREMKLLLLEEGHCFRDQALAVCDAQTASPREVLDANSLSTLVQMVSAGIGVTLIPEMALPVETRSADVSVARFPGRTPARTIGMVWRKSSPLAGQLAKLADVIGAVAPLRVAVKETG